MTLKFGFPLRDSPTQDKAARKFYRNGLYPCWSSHYLKYILFTTVASSVVGSYPAQECENQVLNSSTGLILSPNYPNGHLYHLSCMWTIKSFPNRILIIKFEDIDIADDDDCDNPPCCRQNWLKIGSFRNKTVHVLCGHNLEPYPINMSDTVWLKFHIRTKKGSGRGFKLKYSIVTRDLPTYNRCKYSEHRCDNGQCISKSLLCNGDLDCQDNSDEINCPFNEFCPQNMTWCGGLDRKCFWDSQRCDGVFNCPNGKDEISCAARCRAKIQCKSGNGCYDWRERCNGIAECKDYSDEKNCDVEQCQIANGAFLCNNQRCIPESWLCDETNDCGDNSDEQACIKNSVITAAVMGSLICGLLLVIAIGCTCKLYALRLQDHRNSRCTTILSHIEREILQREPPPSYSLAINDPSAHYFQQAHVGLIDTHCFSSRARSGRRIRRLRRHRRRPPTPPPQILPLVHESNNLENSTGSLFSTVSSREICPLHSSPSDSHTRVDNTVNVLVSSTNVDATNVPSMSFIQEIASKLGNKLPSESISLHSAMLNSLANTIQNSISEEQVVVEPSTSYDESLSPSSITTTDDAIASASFHSTDSFTSLVFPEENADHTPLLLPKL